MGKSNIAQVELTGDCSIVDEKVKCRNVMIWFDDLFFESFRSNK